MSVSRQSEQPETTIDDDHVFTVEEYCAADKVSRAMVYKEWAAGEGVEYFRRGNKICITQRARRRHHAALEQKAREERAGESPSAEAAL
jgi:hypothetical protein